MFRNVVRSMLLMAPALTLAGCGQSDREAELEKQLAEAKAQAADQTAARKTAEASEKQSREAELARFYAGEDVSTEESPKPDDQPQDGAPAANDAATAPQPASAPPPSGISGSNLYNGPFRIGEKTEPVG